MILSNCPPTEIADVVGCSERSVFAIQSNLLHFWLHGSLVEWRRTTTSDIRRSV